MSTRNITGMNPARRANAAVAESALARAEQLAAEARRVTEQRDQDVQNAQIAARALEQEANDQLAVIGEEVGQVSYIINGNVEPAPAAPEPPVDDAPPIEPPAQPEEPEPADLPEEPPAQPDAPTAVLPAQPEPQEAPQRPRWFDPRGWSWLQWLLAVLLGLIALYIGLRTVSWATSDWNVGWPEWLVAILAIVFGLVWVIVFTAVGFFGGALLGHSIPLWIARRRNRDNNHPVAPVPPIPAAPPANPPTA